MPVKPKSEDDAINKGIEVQIDESADGYQFSGVLYRAEGRQSFRVPVRYSTLSIRP